MAIRVFWTDEHPIARYQEMMLFPEAGIEVVPTRTDIQTSWLDSRHHDESHRLYPRWRSFATLPINVAERVRNMQVWEREFDLDRQEARLINLHFDAIVINCSTAVLQNIMRWYTGYIVIRCCGAPNAQLLHAEMAALFDLYWQAGKTDRFIYLPSQSNLVPNNMRRLNATVIRMPTFVDKDRISLRWKGNLNGEIATAISYIDFHKHFQSQLHTIEAAYEAQPFIVNVFGKNRKLKTAADNVRIIGGIPNEMEMWDRIFSCNALVDAGNDPTHNIWPPAEASTGGMPIFMSENNGVAHMIRDWVPEARVDQSLGVLRDHHAIVDHLKKASHDRAYLTELSRRQRAVIEKTYSRDEALKAVDRIKSMITHPIRRMFGGARPQRINMFLVRGSSLRSLFGEKPSFNEVRMANLTFGMRIGNVRPTAYVKNGQNGSVRFARALFEPARVLNAKFPGIVPIYNEFLPTLEPGAYEIALTYSAANGTGEREIAVAMGIGYWQENKSEFAFVWTQGTTDGHSVTALLEVADDYCDTNQKIRISVNRNMDVELMTLSIRKRSDANTQREAI